jgi:signal transduction histidine kinase
VTAFAKLWRTTAFKLSLLYLVIFAIFASFILGYVGWNARRLLDGQIAQSLEAEINGLAEQYRVGGIRRLAGVIDRRARQPGSFLYLVQGPAGETLAGNITATPGIAGGPPTIRELPYQRVDDADYGQRVALIRNFQLPGGYRLAVGRDLEERERLRFVMRRAVGFSLAFMVLFGFVGAFIIARRVLARMDGITARADEIMAGNLSQRLPVRGGKDELDRLAISLNTMLARIEDLLKGMREVSDNIAHDLKTPLTRLKNSSEHALRTAKSPDDYRQALERTIEESDGLIRTFNALLLIARAEAGSGSDAFVPVDLAGLALDMAELYEPVAEETGLVLHVHAPPMPPVKGSRELLGQVLTNLIDNALKYGKPASGAGEVRIALAGEGDDVLLSVSDRGAGIPAEDRARAVERFARLDESRGQPGSGLGLSLAQAVARLHGGRLVLSDNQPGLKVTMALPAARHLGG